MSRRRSAVRQYSVEEQALTDISESKEAENRLAAKRAARAEAREIRTREMERQQKEADEKERLGSDYGAARSRQPSSTSGSRRGSIESSEGTNDSTSSKDRNLKMEMRTLEEKYKAAMITSAQVENERQSLVYQVELLKDQLEEMIESHTELQREYKEKNTNLELTKRELQASQLDVKSLREQNDYKDRLITESGFVIVAAEDGELALERSSEPPSANGPVGTGGLLLSSESLVLLNKGREGSLGMHSLASSHSATHTPQSAPSTDPSQPPSHTRAEEPQSQSPVQAESSESVTGHSSEGSSVDGPMIQRLPENTENCADSSQRAADKAETGVCVEAVDALSDQPGAAVSHSTDDGEFKECAQEADENALLSNTDAEGVSNPVTSQEGMWSESTEESTPDGMQTCSHGKESDSCKDEGRKLSDGAVGLEQNSVASLGEDQTDSSPDGSQSLTETKSNSEDSQSNLPSIVLTECSHNQRADSRDSEDEDVEFYDAVSTPLPSPLDTVFSEFAEKEVHTADQVAGGFLSESGEKVAGEDDKEMDEEDDGNDAGEDGKEIVEEDDGNVVGKDGKEIAGEDDEEVAEEEGKEIDAEDGKEEEAGDITEAMEKDGKEIAGEDDKEVAEEKGKEIDAEDGKEEEGGDITEAMEKDGKEVDSKEIVGDDQEVDRKDGKEIAGVDGTEVHGEDGKEIVEEVVEIPSDEKLLEKGVEGMSRDMEETDGKSEDKGSDSEAFDVKDNQVDTDNFTVDERNQKPSGLSSNDSDENKHESDTSYNDNRENNVETDGRTFVLAESDAEVGQVSEKVDIDHGGCGEGREEPVSVRKEDEVSVDVYEARETGTGSDENTLRQSQIPCVEVSADSEETAVTQSIQDTEKRPDADADTHTDDAGYTCTEKTDEKEDLVPSLPDSTESQTLSASSVEAHQASSSPADDEPEDVQKSSQGESELEEKGGGPAVDEIQNSSLPEDKMDHSGPIDSQEANLSMEDGEDIDKKSKEKSSDQSQMESASSEDNSKLDAEGGVEEDPGPERKEGQAKEEGHEESEEVPDTLSPMLDSRKPMNRKLSEGGTSEDSSAQLNDDEYDFDDIDAVLDHDSPGAKKGKDAEPSSCGDSDDKVSFGSKDSGLQDSVANKDDEANKEDTTSFGSRDSGLQESAPIKESESECRDTVSVQSRDSGAGIEDISSLQSPDSSSGKPAPEAEEGAVGGSSKAHQAGAGSRDSLDLEARLDKMVSQEGVAKETPSKEKRGHKKSKKFKMFKKIFK